ncbi:hypothetical protein ACFL59_12405, partial [Planctomycetota bacterium]
IQLDGELHRTRNDLDIVILLSGDEVSGQVELRQNGRVIAVVQKTGGEVTFDQRQVRTILWSHRAESEQKAADGGGIGRTVELLLNRVIEGTPEDRGVARDQLLDLGVFALPYLETRKGREDDPPEARKILEKVLEVAHIRSYGSSFLIERVPNLGRRLADPDPEVRLAALKEAVVVSPRDCPPLLLHLAKKERTSHVRAFVLGQLSLMNRTEELAELLESEDGSLRLAAALALGDNGVHVGIEYVIDALGHSSPEVRKVAIGSLERWTGQFLGFFAEDEEGKRQKAIVRWQTWFEKDGQQFVEQSLRATVDRNQITQEEKDEGHAYWTRAQILWRKVVEQSLDGEARRDELLKVQFLLRKALEKYPHFLNARLALAELCLTELDSPEDARIEIDLVLRRYADDAGVDTKKQAYYCLGLIGQREHKWPEAERHLRKAAALAPNDYRIARAMGRLSYDRALNDPDLVGKHIRAGKRGAPQATPATAKDVAKARVLELKVSVAAFTASLKKLEAYEEEVEQSKTSADTGATDEELPFEVGLFLTKLRAMKDHLRREAAELHFLRARSYAALQQDELAYSDYLQAKKLQPSNVIYHSAVEVWKPKAKASKTGGTQPDGGAKAKPPRRPKPKRKPKPKPK